MAEGNPTYGTSGLVALTIAHRMKNLVDQVFKRTVLLFLLGGAEGRSPRSQPDARSTSSESADRRKSGPVRYAGSRPPRGGPYPS